MSPLSLKPKQASMVWLEPHSVHGAGRTRPIQGGLLDEPLAQILAALPPGPTSWVVDDAWIPSILMRDIVEVPTGTEAREAFLRWRYSQSLATDTPQFVQSLNLGGNAWLLAGIDEELRDGWVQAASAAGRPMRSLVPRWLWLYNRLAPSREVPGLLLSLCPLGDGTYSGTLVAWGKDLALLRQWTEPATPEVWNQERVLPTVAYLQRDTRAPQELHLWGAESWPEGPVPIQILQPELPSQETR